MIDYYLHLATVDLVVYGVCYHLIESGKITRIDPQSIGRYLDGEEEQEGTYR